MKIGEEITFRELEVLTREHILIVEEFIARLPKMKNRYPALRYILEDAENSSRAYVTSMKQFLEAEADKQK